MSARIVRRLENNGGEVVGRCIVSCVRSFILEDGGEVK